MQPRQSLLGLNEAQKKAVLHAEGPLLIVAGAGAGKTKTLVHRILGLIEAGVVPADILAITFTNKAAEEMRARVMGALERRPGGVAPLPRGETPMVKTFHSLGVFILKEEAKAAGLPRHFGIVDESEAVALIKEAIVEQNLDPKQFEPRRLKNLVSREKGDFVTLEAFGAKAEGYFPKILANVWRRYEEKLREAHALDFDDLILKTVTLLS
ncbi:MAG: UvrD-helicase domain-containing protein, partial [bacterium]|nr:UvrD-helicase domain-containing protein [bacterium]